MLSKTQAKARTLSRVLDFLNRHHWQDSDDFSLRLVDRIAPIISTEYLSYSSLFSATKTKTCFFVVNHVSRKVFCTLFIKELSPYLKEIGVATNLGSLSFSKLFPEILSVNPDKAEELLPKLKHLEERKIQDAFRYVLREKGATNMVRRKSDSSLEVADLEDFVLKIGERDVSFTSVIKGYKSVKHPKIGLGDISHQIMKAFNGTFPDYILLVLAKSPVDGVITNLTRYGESVGNRNLIVLMDPIDLTRFLYYYKVI
jgi:hypothetical protein